MTIEYPSQDSSSWVSGQEFAVKAARDAVVKALGPAVPEVEYDFFERHLLPPLHPSIDIDTVLARLEADKIIVDGRWQRFSIDPWKNAVGDANNERSMENEVFAALVPLVDDITRRSGADAPETLAFKCLPDYTPPCSFEKKKGRPDGFFVFNPEIRPANRPYWCDLATPAEFKLRDRHGDLQDDIRKICWNMHQVMREDPRRRFVFGFTIENTQMRVWMLNRSDAVVSEPFNFITDHKKFLHFFLSQTYASPHQLGIDTTMSVVQGPSSGELVYDITVHDANSESFVFRTEGLINDDGAKSPLGRGTRVWRVKRLVDGEPDASKPGRVLKDSWVDEDREREGDILKQILSTPGLDDTEKQALADLFLTHVVSGDVIIDGNPDSTRGFLNGVTDMLDYDTKLFMLRVSPDHKPSHKEDKPGSNAPSIAPATDSQRVAILKYSEKRHYRVVFVEECEPLSKQTSLRMVFDCLCDITTALNALHLLGPGWVHRDISTGNILYVRETNKWVLSDMEYTKRLDNDNTHGIRTGTANFMAIEVDCGMCLSDVPTLDAEQLETPQKSVKDLLKRKALGNKRESRAKMLSVYKQQQQQANTPSRTTRKAFHYNPTHDLESLFWIALYFVINKEARPATLSDSSNSSPDLELSLPNTSDQQSHSSSPTESPRFILDPEDRTFARSLFYSNEARAAALVSGMPLEKYFQRRQAPEPLAKIGKYLRELREILCKHYITIGEPDYHIDNLVCQNRGLYDQFETRFAAIIETIAETQDIIVSPIPPDLNMDGVLRSVSNTASRASLLSAFKSKLKRKAAPETPRTLVLPAPKKTKPAQCPSEPCEASGSKDVFD